MKQRMLPGPRRHACIAAFALVRARGRLRRRRHGDHGDADGNTHHVRIDGEKTWISNGGIADHYVVFARTGEAPGARGLSAFWSTPTRPA
jgi:acyl-CoA dehydrogenase